jgi:hypothetical protein
MRTIVEEAERLNRFIGNLLDMARLESGPLKPQTGPADLSDIIGATLQRADKILQNHSVAIDLESGLPLLDLDMVLMEQVLFNLFDNATKYAPQGSRITITARHEDGSAVIHVLDEGEGILVHASDAAEKLGAVRRQALQETSLTLTPQRRTTFSAPGDARGAAAPDLFRNAGGRLTISPATVSSCVAEFDRVRTAPCPYKWTPRQTKQRKPVVPVRIGSLPTPQ